MNGLNNEHFHLEVCIPNGSLKRDDLLCVRNCAVRMCRLSWLCRSSSPSSISLLTFSCLSSLLACQQTFGIQHLAINFDMVELSLASLNHSTQIPSFLSLPLSSGDLSCKSQTLMSLTTLFAFFSLLSLTHTSLFCLLCLHAILQTSMCPPPFPTARG